MPGVPSLPNSRKSHPRDDCDLCRKTWVSAIVMTVLSMSSHSGHPSSYKVRSGDVHVFVDELFPGLAQDRPLPNRFPKLREIQIIGYQWPINQYVSLYFLDSALTIAKSLHRKRFRDPDRTAPQGIIRGRHHGLQWATIQTTSHSTEAFQINPISLKHHKLLNFFFLATKTLADPCNGSPMDLGHPLARMYFRIYESRIVSKFSCYACTRELYTRPVIRLELREVVRVGSVAEILLR